MYKFIASRTYHHCIFSTGYVPPAYAALKQITRNSADRIKRRLILAPFIFTLPLDVQLALPLRPAFAGREDEHPQPDREGGDGGYYNSAATHVGQAAPSIIALRIKSRVYIVGDIYVRCTDDLGGRSYSAAAADIPATGYFALLSPADGAVIDVWASRTASVSTNKALAGTAKIAATEESSNPDAARTQYTANVDVTFTWEEPEAADEYELLVDDNSDFSSPEVDVTGIADETYTHTFTVTPETPTQYWRIVASNSYGDTVCDEDFSFSFNYNDTGIVPTSFGNIKARFNQ
jgi:hypothetical protein